MACSPLTNCPDSRDRSGLLLLKGTAHEALDNRDRAADCYREALVLDVYCFEAFDRLTAHCMLTEDEEHRLLNSLQFSQSGEDEGLVRYLYSSRVKRALPNAPSAKNSALSGRFTPNSPPVFAPLIMSVLMLTQRP
jgi:hypothetical protein